MFVGCENIINTDLSSFTTKYIKNMKTYLKDVRI